MTTDWENPFGSAQDRLETSDAPAPAFAGAGSFDGDGGMDWGGLAQTQFQIEGVRFTVAKLPASQARALWRKLLHEAAKTPILESLGQVDLENPAQALIGVVKGILLLEPGFVVQMQDLLFSQVEYLKEGMARPRPLAGGEDVAFAGLEPADADEVLVRAFAVNFMPSLRRHASRLGSAGATFPQPSPRE